MKGSQIFKNLQQAKSELTRLKQQINIMPSTETAQNQSMSTYVNIMQYNINKFQNHIEKGIIDSNKNQMKLPELQFSKKNNNHKIGKSSNHFEHEAYKTNEDLAPSKAYKNFRSYMKGLRPNTRPKLEQTTTNQASLFVTNKPVKIHSFVEKSIKLQYQSQHRAIGTKLDLNLTKQQNKIEYSKNDVTVDQGTEPENIIRYYNMMMSTSKTNRRDRQKSISLSLAQPNIPIQYKQIVDKFSVFHFMIKRGKFVTDNPQFASFTRIYQSIIRQVRVIILKIQQLLTQYQIQLAYADGRRIAVLALKHKITTQDLIDCLIDNDLIKTAIIPVRKFVGQQGKLKAINLIQSFWRMYCVRKQYKHFKQKILKIQCFVKKRLSKLRTRKQIHQKNQEIYESFLKNQKQFGKQFNQIKETKRVEIHINSFAVDQLKRLTISNFNQRKNLQLSRIFKLKDLNLTIIYITPIDIAPQIINYYYKILDLAGVGNYKQRLIFLKPQAVDIFPQYFSTSKLLYYSPKCLKRIQKLINNRPCYLVPGYPCNQTIKICEYLKINLLSGDPIKCKSLSNKSHAKRLFQASDLPVAPGAIELYDITEFINTLSVLIAKNPYIQTWIFKIDDEFNGRGNAYLNVGKIKSIQRLLNRKILDQFSEGEQFFKTALDHSIKNEEFDQQLTTQIRNILKNVLPLKTVICNQQLYHNYEQYMARYLKKGGIIEGYPSLRKQIIKSPSVSFFIAPDGEIQIISTYQKLACKPHINVGIKFPQQCLEFNTIYKYCKNISEALYIRGAFGYFTLDFLAFKQENEQRYRCWAIGLDTYLNTFTSSFYYFDSLMNGQYLPQESQYIVQEEIIQKNQKSVETMVSSADRLSTRKYMFIPYIHHEMLNTIKMKTFFKNARLSNINYDIQNKQGVCILLVDQLCSGVIGVLAIQRSNQNLIQLMHKSVTFISKQTLPTNVKYGTSQLESRNDNILLRDVISMMTIFKKKNQKTNFAKLAVKKNLINCNLEMIL